MMDAAATDQIAPRRMRWLDLALPIAWGAGVAMLGRMVIEDSLGIALWCIISLVLLLPMMRLSAIAYVLAATPAFVLTAFATRSAAAALVITAVGLSLVGGVWFLTALFDFVARFMPAADMSGVKRSRHETTALAIGVTIVFVSLSFTWPIWAADLLTRIDADPWLQRAINVAPAFVLNGVLSPEDALTHRPLGYRLMNLGQDVNYAMPRSIWACVILHITIGAVGAVMRWSSLPANQNQLTNASTRSLRRVAREPVRAQPERRAGSLGYTGSKSDAIRESIR